MNHKYLAPYLASYGFSSL